VCVCRAHRVSPTRTTYSNLLEALARAGNAAGVEAVVKMCRGDAITPDPGAMTDALLLLERQGRLAAAAASDGPQPEREPSNTPYHTIFPTDGHLQQHAQQVTAPEPASASRGVVLRPPAPPGGETGWAEAQRVLIEVHVKRGEMTAAESLLVTSPRPDPQAYECVMSGWGDRGRPHAVLALMDRLRNAGVTPGRGAYTALINAYTLHEPPDLDKAVAARDEGVACPGQPDEAAFLAWLRLHAKLGDRAAAFEALEGLARVRTPMGLDCEAALPAVTVMLAEMGLVATLKALRELQSRDLIRPTAVYTALLLVLVRREDEPAMRTALAALDGDDVKPDRYLWNALLRVCGALGLGRRAKETLEEMRRLGFQVRPQGEPAPGVRR
jgi:pentatricopeptide repeat protein